MMFRKFTIHEYFAYDKDSLGKSEYVKGEILAMPGASSNHNIVTTKLVSIFDECTENKKDCLVYSQDMKLYMPVCGLSAYPDLMILCGEAEYFEGYDDYVLLNPILVGEVLSDSTENYDRTVKLPCYLTTPSVQVVILASQKEKRIEVYQKNNGNSTVEIFTQGKFKVLDCELDIERIYKKVKI